MRCIASIGRDSHVHLQAAGTLQPGAQNGVSVGAEDGRADSGGF